MARTQLRPGTLLPDERLSAEGCHCDDEPGRGSVVLASRQEPG